MTARMKALLVEDEFLIAADMEMLLNDMGLATTIAATIPDALRLVAEGDIQLAIVDFRLGKLETGAIGEALREKRIPFALCSGSDRGLAHSAFDGVPFMNKPYTDQLFRDTVQQMLGARAPADAGAEP